MSDVLTTERTPFEINSNGVSFCAKSFMTDLTVNDAEQLAKLAGDLIPQLSTLMNDDTIDTLSFYNIALKVLGTGNLKPLLAILIKRTDDVESTDEERLQAVASLPIGRVVELIQSFFSFTGK